jgi:hypothetical protein
MASAAPAQTDLELLDAAGNPTTSLQISISKGATAATRTVYLHRRDSGTTEGDEIELDLELTNGNATITRGDGSSASTPFKIEAGATERVRITVEAPAGSEAAGELIALVGARLEKLASVRVSAPAAPAASFAENKDGIKRTATVTDYTLFLTLAAGEGGAKGVQVTVSDLTDTTGAQVPVSVAIDGSSGPIDLPELGTAKVSLTMQLGRVGDYSGTLVLVHDGKREAPVPLTISRTQLQPTVEVLALSRLASDGGPIVLEALVHESSGSPLVLDRPQLVALGRKDGDSHTGPSFESDDVTIVRVNADGGTRTAVGTRLELAGGETVTLRFTVEDVGGPGEYGARLRLTSPGSTAVSSDLTFLVRQPWWLAALVIFGGVLASFLFRDVLLKRGARARQQIQLRQLMDELARLRARQGELDADAAEAFDVLNRRLATLFERSDLNASQLADEIAKVNVQLTLLGGWLRTRKRLRSLPPSDVTDELWVQLEEARANALSATADKAALDAARQELTKLETEVDAAVRARVRTEAEQLLAQARSAVGEQGFIKHDASKEAITGKVIPRLEEAAKLADSGDTWLGAVRAFEQARAVYATALLEDLAAKMSEPAPPEMLPPEWDGLRARVNQVVTEAGGDPERRLDDYSRALGIYLTRVAEAAQQLAQKREDDLRKVRNPTSRQKAALLLYADAGREAGRVPALLATLDHVAAHATYARARKLIEEGEKELAQAGFAAAPRRLPASVPSPPPHRTSLTLAQTADGGRDHRDLKNQSELSQLIGRLEFLVAVFSLLAATVLGLVLLYEPNNTWGDFGDILIAILWGIGLHQVAGQTVQGYRGVQTSLTTP